MSGESCHRASSVALSDVFFTFQHFLPSPQCPFGKKKKYLFSWIRPGGIINKDCTLSYLRKPHHSRQANQMLPPWNLNLDQKLKESQNSWDSSVPAVRAGPACSSHQTILEVTASSSPRVALVQCFSEVLILGFLVILQGIHRPIILMPANK